MIVPVTLITGAASGIGLATAEALAPTAERLVLVDPDADALAALTLPCTVDLLPGDVADEDFWEFAGPFLGGLTHVVVNAGVAGAGVIAGLTFDE